VGKLLIVAGVVLIVAGLLVVAGERAGIKLGHLPGDMVVRGKNTTFYFPLVTCILVSVILTLISWLFGRR